MQLNEIQALVAKDMDGVNASIRAQLHSDVVLIEQMGEYIVNSGGKRLRPVIAVLAARACGYDGDKHYLTAAIIEFIHTATLLHDDVVDSSELRRGKETANSIWGNEASVLVGDFIFSRAFEMMVQVGDMRVMDILSTTSNTIAEGEVLQLMNCNEPETTEEQYMQVIKCKTARLFGAAAQIGALLAGRSLQEEQSLEDYGNHLGTAFQLIDDVLDYRADSATMGKNVGDDLAEGKPTLPIIHALKNASEEHAKQLAKIIQNGDRNSLGFVMSVIRQTKALEYTEDVALKEAEKAKQALNWLPNTEYKNALNSLAEFSVSRLY
ncbi:MAG: octaprenyl diphosphate synthase [Gammaproteobacteria bacterium]|nr:octaprenyl diphosphate synthase [Gammaproteobacteria bacterium]